MRNYGKRFYFNSLRCFQIFPKHRIINDRWYIMKKAGYHFTIFIYSGRIDPPLQSYNHFSFKHSFMSLKTNIVCTENVKVSEKLEFKCPQADSNEEERRERDATTIIQAFASSCIIYNNNNNGYIGYRVHTLN